MVSSSIKLDLDNFTGGMVRAAFPAYKVFIFGHEVTSDVVEVRVNHSGGSAERAAGTCSFTLVNPNNKYTLTYGDMLKIGEGAAAYREYRKEQWADNGFGGTTPQEVAELQKYAELWKTVATLTEEEKKILEDSKNLGKGHEPPASLLEKAQLYDETLVEDKAGVEAAYKQIAKNLTESSYAIPFSPLTIGAFSAQEFGLGTIKTYVLLEKIKFHSDVTYNNENSNLAKLEDRTLMQYPFQQGDCIFHPNDPVRVAFRDPFDPRVWYWMFTGFMDAWTENSGVNKDSTITINCTDVTKVARYSFIQVGTGLQDANIEDLFNQIDPTTQASKGVQYFTELFARFTMLEVLETLFFGTKDTAITIDDVIRAQVSLMSEEALEQALTKLDPGFVDKNSLNYLNGAEQRISTLSDKLAQERKKLIDQAGKLPPLCVPAPYMKGAEKYDAATEEYNASSGVIVAKRKNYLYGVNAYFYGDLTPYDKTLGEGLPSLHDWNEIIHHRVRPRDLIDMNIHEANRSSNNMDSYSPVQIIDVIGTGKTEFPVGHGRVFYVSRAQLASGSFGRQIIDRSFGGTSGLFSIFKDKLSYIYDMADRVDFRFYATPKGDYVYEMPFYDFDPIYFMSDSMEDWELKPDQVSTMQDSLRSSEEVPFSVQDLEAIGFYKDYDAAKDLLTWGNAEPFDYKKTFTIERDEQLGFSNTATDKGIATVFRCKPNTIASMASVNGDIKKYRYIADKGAIMSLGVRVAEADVWGFITSEEDADAYAALMLARVNAEAKNVSVSTLPKFGLMVNRPLFWRERNYYANIVSLQHSIVWNSSADTTVNLNQLRGWSGETHPDTGYPVHRHFSGSDRPFSMGEISSQTTKTKNTQGN